MSKNFLQTTWNSFLIAAIQSVYRHKAINYFYSATNTWLFSECNVYTERTQLLSGVCARDTNAAISPSLSINHLISVPSSCVFSCLFLFFWRDCFVRCHVMLAVMQWVYFMVLCHKWCLYLNSVQNLCFVDHCRMNKTWSYKKRKYRLWYHY